MNDSSLNQAPSQQDAAALKARSAMIRRQMEAASFARDDGEWYENKWLHFLGAGLVIAIGIMWFLNSRNEATALRLKTEVAAQEELVRKAQVEQDRLAKVDADKQKETKELERQAKFAEQNLRQDAARATQSIDSQRSYEQQRRDNQERQEQSNRERRDKQEGNTLLAKQEIERQRATDRSEREHRELYNLLIAQGRKDEDRKSVV